MPLALFHAIHYKEDAMPCVGLIGARTFRFIASALAGAVLVFSGASAADAASSFRQNPIVFVHGIEGSGAQFESQKMRFMSNGYPERWIDEVDYNSTRAVALTNGNMAAQRRANVAHYINVDGQNKNPGVPTLAVWAGRGTPGRNMDGAENVTIPDQTHVQTCTSAESFVQYYGFLTGRRPKSDIVPQSRSIEIAGKALNFPENRGLSGGTVQIWQVNDSGQRTSAVPVASLPITDGSTGGGAWGPVSVMPGQRYEFALVQTGLPTLHIYYEPFVRSDYTLRLLASLAIEEYVGNRPGSVSAVMIRYKELWGDQGSENDQLLINGLNVCTEVLCPISKQVNAFFAFDRNDDKQTDLSEPDPVLSGLPFIQGADVYIPASSPPDETASFQLISRGGGPVRTLNVPNWDSSTDGVTIQWSDFDKLTF